jgi:hypothetical protein
LLQTLYLLNDGEILNEVTRRDGWIARLERQFDPNPRPAKPVANAGPAINRFTEQSARAQVVKNLGRKIAELRTAGKTEDAGRLERVQKAAERAPQPVLQAPAPRSAPSPGSPGPADLRHWIEEAYLRTVCRLPSDQERARSEEYLRGAPTPARGMRDVLWALLNTDEFIVNH